jgi:predicted nucleic acid-binding protein
MVETFAALARRARGGDLRRHHAIAAFNRAEQEFLVRFIFVEVTNLIIYRAMQLARKHALRGYDAMHLAAVLDFQSRIDQEVIFVCADRELNRAAADHYRADRRRGGKRP